MKTTIFAAALAVAALSTLAQAQTTVIEERSSPSVTIERDRPAASTTTIERRDPAVVTEKRTTVETTGSGRDCSTKSVHKEDAAGATTVTRKDCD